MVVQFLHPMYRYSAVPYTGQAVFKTESATTLDSLWFWISALYSIACLIFSGIIQVEFLKKLSQYLNLLSKNRI